jgi:hypothetical protein
MQILNYYHSFCCLLSFVLFIDFTGGISGIFLEIISSKTVSGCDMPVVPAFYFDAQEAFS